MIIWKNVPSNLSNLKSKLDKLHVRKLVPIPVDLSKLSDAVKNDIVKKAVYDKSAEKVNNIDTSTFVLKTKYDTDKKELKENITLAQALHSEFVAKAIYVIDKFKL